MSQWRLTIDRYDPAREAHREALFALGNGMFVTRGAGIETSADGIHYPGTYRAGGYNRLPTEIAGRIIENEDLVNLPNWLPLRVRIANGPWFSPDQARLLDYRQVLDMARGILHRTIRFVDEQGRRTTLAERRLVHMRYPHIAAIELTVTAEDWSGTVDICSALDGRVVNGNVARYRNLSDRHLVPLESGADQDQLFLKMQTSQSELRIAEAARTTVSRDGEALALDWRTEIEPDRVCGHATVALHEGESFVAEKVVALYSSRDSGISECGLTAREVVTKVPEFDQIVGAHVSAWKQLWRRFGSQWMLSGSADEERIVVALRLHLFHLLQTVSFHTEDLDVGVPARGWHGEAYRGHVFWDELFIFPLLNLRIPEITRALLKYRYRRLDMARRNAREAGLAGAMYPWQSGSDGREESQRIHLNPASGRWIPDHSHLQRHVNIAIAYNIWQYHEVSGDEEFLAYHGAEMFIEIARFLASLTSYNPQLDRFEILGVMGPDEYHEGYPDREQPGLDNNTYTNVMTAWVLERASALLGHLSSHRRTELREHLALMDDELLLWDRISRRMRLVFHQDGLLSQFEGYESLDEFDWESYRSRYGNIQRLDRILESEGDSPNRYKLSKQSDLLMLFYLLSPEELCDLIARLGYPLPRDRFIDHVNYYLERTSHGSTLSRVVHSWVLARGDRARSWQQFHKALMADVQDAQGGTTAEGIHLGAMAGSVDLLTRGYTGLETRAGCLWLDPCLPDELRRLQLRLRYRRHLLILKITHTRLRLESRKRDVRPITVRFRGQTHTLPGGECLTLDLNRSAG
jgi:alpha,alpha-trehalase